jgi:adenylylsulfate kinase
MTTKPNPGFVIWFTGLPASGKSTLARLLQRELAGQQIKTQLLDSDELRRQLTPQPTYSPSERDWFYDTVVFLAQLLSQNGVNVLIAATAPRRHHRDAARNRLSRFVELFVDCPPEICQARDPKGLWQLAQEGEITSLPGAGAPYEAPQAPEIHVKNHEMTAEEAVSYILRLLPSFLTPVSQNGK